MSLEVINTAILVIVFAKISLNKTIPDFIGGMAIGAVYFVITVGCPDLDMSGSNLAIILPLSYYKRDYEHGIVLILSQVVGAFIGVFIHNLSDADAKDLRDAIHKAESKDQTDMFDREFELKETNRNNEENRNQFVEYEKDQLIRE